MTSTQTPNAIDNFKPFVEQIVAEILEIKPIIQKVARFDTDYMREIARWEISLPQEFSSDRMFMDACWGMWKTRKMAEEFFNNEIAGLISALRAYPQCEMWYNDPWMNAMLEEYGPEGAVYRNLI